MGIAVGRVLRLHPRDNVALALEPLPPGTEATVGEVTVRLRDPIPYGHKFALYPIPRGGQVIKYGCPIGRATRDISPGEHVHVHNLESGRSYGDTSPLRAEQISSEAPPLPCTHFLGYRRSDGRVGVRNHVLVLAAVHCVNGVVERIGREIPGIVALPHIYGCSQLGEDLEVTIRVLKAYASHPNVGATLLVGLGCEALPTADLAEELRAEGYRLELLLVQEVGGSRAAVERGRALATELLREISDARREPVPLSELVVGVECGGSDAWSGVTANPVVGAVADALVGAGGTVILSEVTEFIGAERILAARAISPEVGEAILRAVARREAVAGELGVDLRGAQPSPGNVAGGITTIEEKSLGAIAKGGTTPVMEFLPYGGKPTARGLVVMDTSGNDPESVTGMVAGGAQLILFTTGRGTPLGSPTAPVIKIASNTPLFERMRDDLDFDAGPVLDGKPISQLAGELLALLVEVAEGRPTRAEEWGHREFAIESRAPRV
ncbi:UxaA family hydrolase [Candidatus Bipolaricaulota sp. J31]